MTALSAMSVFTLSWWLGLYLVVRDPRKPVLALAALGLCGFAAVVALDAVRVTATAHTELLSRIEIYLVVVPGVAWFAVVLELARTGEAWRSRAGELGRSRWSAGPLGGRDDGRRSRRAAAGRALADGRGHFGVDAGCDGRGSAPPPAGPVR